ncbi:MAG TPA: RsmE family RNA methyltransferase [Candidatus Acidoferrales bacterium]|nr:RsmE family RNA methyltransferase [Candidatus Acidoferrales bacterium]
MRRRFFVDKFEAGRTLLRGEAAEHLGRVLRAVPGQLYELSDGAAVWLARVTNVSQVRSNQQVEFTLVEKLPASEPALQIRLLLSIVKFERIELCLEKATELGVTEIVPVAAARSEKALVLAAAKRRQRWGKILLESAQQSRRLRPPALAPATKTPDAFASANEDLRILLSERADAPPLRDILRDQSSQGVCVAIGPEGGWTEDEFDAATKNGFREASLGREILRTETAAIAALAVLRYALDPVAPAATRQSANAR